MQERIQISRSKLYSIKAYDRAIYSLELAKKFENLNHFEAYNCYKRAFNLGIWENDVLKKTFELSKQLSSADDIIDMSERIAYKLLSENKINQAFYWMDINKRAYNISGNGDLWRFNHGFHYALKKLHQNYESSFNSNESFKYFENNGSEKKIKIIYNTHGVYHPDSVLMKILLTLAENHDKSSFQIFFLNTEKIENEASKNYEKRITELGHRFFTPKSTNLTERTAELKNLIDRINPDLYVITAGLMSYYDLFVSMFRGKALLISNSLGVNEQFLVPDSVAAITPNRSIQKDLEVDCYYAPIQLPLKKIQSYIKSKNKKNCFTILICGRIEKIYTKEIWGKIKLLLTTFDDIHFNIVGGKKYPPKWILEYINKDQLNRVCFIDWNSNYTNSFIEADLMIDTLPQGGGVVVMDAFEHCLPVIMFRHPEWRLMNLLKGVSSVEDHLTLMDLVINPNDDKKLVELVHKLKSDLGFYREISRKCHQERLKFSSPKSMTLMYEAAYHEIMNKSS